MPEIHFVTGATGFVGSALVLELLRATDVSVVCLVRAGGDTRAAQQRLEQTLNAAAAAFGLDEVIPSIARRCRAVAGDLSLPLCGVAPGAVPEARELWHCAASLRHEEKHREEILEQNVGGTERAVALARALGVTKLSYVSTAYVAGSRRGRILEEPASLDTPVNNVYESSKLLAEHRVAQSGLDYRILRPSIVVGHSKTHAVLNPSGFYLYVRRLAQLRRVLERRGELALAGEIEIEADLDATLNLIPVDAVASACVRISRARTDARIFHLTNSEPPRMDLVGQVVNDTLGMAGPRLTPSLSSTSEPTQQLARVTRFFLSYMRSPKQFDRTHTDRAAGAESSRWPLERQGIERYVRWYLEHGDSLARGAK